MEQQSFFRSVLHRAHLAHKSFVILECAPDGVQIPGWELTRAAGLSADESHAKHRTHSIEFKRQIAQTLQRRDLCLVVLKQISRLGVIIERPSLELPHPQHRIQTADRPGLHCRRDASCSRQPTRHLTQPHPNLGRKFEAGAFDDDAQAADLLQDYEAKIAALERMVGRQALEIEFLKGALKNAARPRRSKSVSTGPVVSPSPQDAGSTRDTRPNCY